MSESNLNTTLSTYNDIENVIQKTSNNFSFVDTLGSFINNKEFASGYYNYADGHHTSNAFIWEVLACIGNHIGSIVYSNVLNYIDNICNIDLCNIKALKSILQSFGLKYSIIDNLDIIPDEILNVINVLSINKKYLLNSGIISEALANELSCVKYNIKLPSSLDKLSDKDRDFLNTRFNDISANFTPNIVKNIRINDAIDDDLYEQFLTDVYTKILVSFTQMPYALSSDYDNVVKDNEYKFYPIYKTYGSIINNTEEKNKLIEPINEKIYQLKIKNNIVSFDEKNIVNNINKGLDSLANYSGTELEILNLEISNRELPKYNDIPTSKFAYYKEKKVYEYFDFIINKFGNFYTKPNDYKDYIIDKTYFEIEPNKNPMWLLLRDDNTGFFELTENYNKLIQYTVKNLVYYTLNIVKLREKLKLLLQKNNMKGTFNLLSYAINEYLISLAKSNIFYTDNLTNNLTDNITINNDYLNTVKALSSHIQSDIELIEYYDKTEYFNISTENSAKALNKDSVNNPFWENINNPAFLAAGNFAFTANDIENFYLSTLNLKNTTNDLVSFLSTIYQAGANTSYLDINGIEKIVTNAELSNNSIEMFAQFTGNSKVGILPYYNHKNITHPSYQIHPYLYNFIEASNYSKAIENGFLNDIVEKLADETILQLLSSNIGEYGQVVNVAINNSYDFTGYRSRYEASTHKSDVLYSNKQYPVINYDGAFYPDAVKMFIDDSEACIKSLSSRNKSENDCNFYTNYYEHLNLNDEEIIRICNQLSVYKDDIIEKAADKSEIKDVWDIYKYTRDKYDNHYILYKNYNNANPTEKEKRNTTGELWIRLNNHPIAFPAIAIKNNEDDYKAYTLITYIEDYVNGKFIDDLFNLDKIDKETFTDYNNILANEYKQQLFFDMEFDFSRSILFLAFYPKYDTLIKLNAHTCTLDDETEYECNIYHTSADFENVDKIYKDYEHAQFIICLVNMRFNDNLNYNQLELNSNRSDADNIDGYVLPNRFLYTEDYNPKFNNTNRYAFQGFYVDENITSLIFINKRFIKNSDDLYKYLLANNDKIQVGIVNFILNNSFKEIYDDSHCVIQYEGCEFENTSIGYNYYNNTLVFAIPTKSTKTDFRTYIGTINKITDTDAAVISNDYGKVNYKNNSLNTDNNEVNSFDILDEHIGVGTLKIHYNDIKFSNFRLHNLIASPSYIPLFANDDGKIDISKCEYYNSTEKAILPILLLGRSNDITDLIAATDPNINVYDTIEILHSRLQARVYEDFDNLNCDAINILDNDTIMFSGNKETTEYGIKLDYIPDKDIENIKILLYNSKTYGKNNYYNGLLMDLSAKNTDDYTALNYAPALNEAEIEFTNDQDIRIAGTYSAYANAQNRSENNAIFNIKDIKAKYNKYTKTLTLQFTRTDKENNAVIPFGLVKCVIINETNLNAFNYHHLLDQYGTISSVISNNKDYRYTYIDENTKVFLSNYNLNELTSLTEIPYLSSFDSPAFKYNENSVQPESSKIYYKPGYNNDLPKTCAQIYDIHGYGRTTDILSNLTNDKDIYIIKYDDYNTLLNLGEVKIPIIAYDDETIRVYEDYLSDDYNTDTDTINILLALHKFKFLEHNDADEISTSLSAYNKITKNPTELHNEYSELKLNEFEVLKNEDLGDAKAQSSMYHMINTSNIISNSSDARKKINDLFNIYITYDKNNEMYFNYLNYFCTPYVKIEGEKIFADYIDNTYLRLKPGEDGLLDIILQFKYYRDDHYLYGYSNIKIATYRIFNISDDKPKFLIYKV